MGIYQFSKTKPFSNPKKDGETAEYLRYVQNKILNKVKVGRQKDVKEAKQIQSFLNVLKRTDNIKDIKTLGDLISKDALAELMEDLPNDLFRLAYNPKSVAGQLYDDFFERDFNTTLQALANIKNDEVNFYAGTQSANTVLNREILQKTIDEIQTNYSKTLIEDMKISSPNLKNIFYNPESRAQKADIKVDIDTTIKLKPEYQQILNLFKGKSFSLKNYSSGNYGKSLRVSLGTTSPLKAFIGVFAYLKQGDQTFATTAFYASLASYTRSLKRGNNKIIQSLRSSIFSIRYYYELTGVGLRINGEMLEAVDFLVVNNPDGGIAVKSTKDLVYQLLSANSKYLESFDPYRDVHAYVEFDN